MAGLLPIYSGNLQVFAEAAYIQTAMTHANKTVLTASEFFAMLVDLVLGGMAPDAAVKQSLEHRFHDTEIAPLIAKGLESYGENTRAAIGRFGQMCSIKGALPGAVHLLVNYPDNLQQALIENVRAGGDSAARGIPVGMILGASLGLEAIPATWKESMQASPIIQHSLDRCCPEGY